ncbi:hypothetical protein [Agromyces sp. NPDC058104]|uniref:hypothetical protein n=1 Tax=Agromyces sp. NPDC058104 TaxID=3346342 RepID=UPI0036D96EC8
MILATAAGCSSAEESSDPWAAQIRDAKASAASDFERDVLNDDVISRAEYEEAMDRFVQCMNDSGLPTSKGVAGDFYNVSTSYPNGADTSGAVESECGQGTNGLIEVLYVSMTQNPENRPYNEVLAECFQRTGITKDGATRSDLDAAFEEDRLNEVVDVEAQGFTDCMSNPSH